MRHMGHGGGYCGGAAVAVARSQRLGLVPGCLEAGGCATPVAVACCRKQQQQWAPRLRQRRGPRSQHLRPSPRPLWTAALRRCERGGAAAVAAEAGGAVPLPQPEHLLRHPRGQQCGGVSGAERARRKTSFRARPAGSAAGRRAAACIRRDRGRGRLAVPSIRMAAGAAEGRHALATCRAALVPGPRLVESAQRTVTAMAKVGIPAEQREAVLACTAAVLHLGNVAFAEGRDADSSMVKTGGAAEEALAAAGGPGGAGGGMPRALAAGRRSLMRGCCMGLKHAALGLLGPLRLRQRAIWAMWGRGVVQTQPPDTCADLSPSCLACHRSRPAGRVTRRPGARADDAHATDAGGPDYQPSQRASRHREQGLPRKGQRTARARGRLGWVTSLAVCLRANRKQRV
jgi:hypothetical protein